MSARDTILLALTRYYQGNSDPRGTAMQVVAGYDAARRTELLAERTDVRDRMLRDAHAAGRAEALTADGQAYDGELAMLVFLVRALRSTVRENDSLPEVRRLLWLHASDDALARQKAKEKSSPAGADATPDFFQTGQLYTEPDGSTDWKFRCDSITTHPDNGERTALGWRHFRGEWEPYAYGEGDWEIHQIADSIATTQGDSK